MRTRVVLFSVAGLGLALSATLSAVPACSSDGATSDGGSADAAYQDAPTFCDLFTDAGAPCPSVSKTQCFAMCTTGGCYCVGTPSGPRWECTTDFSCIPEAGPLEDTGPGGGDDAASVEDAANTVDDAAASDAAETSDASDAADARGSLDAADAAD